MWLFYNAASSRLFGPPAKFLIFLTNWGFIMWNLYLLVSAVSVSYNQLRYYYYNYTAKRGENRTNGKKCCTSDSDRTTILDKFSWLLFIISTEIAVGIVIFYWLLLSSEFDPDTLYSGGNLSVHLLNGIVALLDLWIIGIPIHILHLFYTLVFASTYATFTGVYYAANGTGQEGERYIYPPLDYGSNPGKGAGLIIGTVLIFLPIVHALFIVQYLIRNWVTSRIHSKILVYKRFLLTADASDLGERDSNSAGASNNSTFTLNESTHLI